MPFWTAVDGVTPDPKRVSRFRVSIGALNNSDYVWYAKSFTKPSAEITTTPHKYLNHTFNYPGSVKWSAVTIDLVDPTDPIDAGGSLAQLLVAMGYEIPAGAKDSEFVNISKRKATTALGDISVSEIDDLGNPLETWTLKQAFVNKFEWGSLKYEGDDLNVLKLSITYDWATCDIERTSLVAATEETAYAPPVGATKRFFE